MDPSHAPFLAAIFADVDSDAPRLQYADFLDETGDPAHAERAEFIRVQCALEGLNKNDPRHDELRGREQELLRTHWRDWFEPVREALEEPAFIREPGFLFGSKRERFSLVTSEYEDGHWVVRNKIVEEVGVRLVGRFRRGIFDSMILGIHPGRDCRSVYERLFVVTPLDDVDFRGGDPDEFKDLMLANRIGRIRRLRFHASTEAMIDALVESVGAAELRSLSISFTFRDATEADENPHPLRKLWQNPNLSRVDRFTCFFDDAVGDLNELIGSSFLRRLRALVVRHPFATQPFLADLMQPDVAPNLEELRVTVEEADALDVDLVHALRSRFGDSLEIWVAP